MTASAGRTPPGGSHGRPRRAVPTGGGRPGVVCPVSAARR
ncbi:hypothetical protein SSTG_05604 [Streptomyces sp. e14]|nr:hypothetical protein SSTG_05604 [Streptomyces sp. e14]